MKYLTSLLLCFLLLQAHATIRYVDLAATGANTGADWADASTTLQPMLTASSDGDTIYVAMGTYQPGANTSYTISNNNIKIFGGFPHGGNPGFANRNWTSYQTLLQGNGIISLFGSIFNNSGTTVIDGFYMTGGGNTVQGGIAYIVGNSPVQFSNCNFYNNNSPFQGGTFYILSNPAIIQNCTFTGNSGASEGEVLFINSSSPQISNCVFTNNNETASGGVVFEVLGSPNISNCTFSNNTVPAQGGMIYLDLGSATINGCSFLNNNVSQELLFYNQASAQISNSVFANNVATYTCILGIIMSPGNSSFVNCLFYNNQATDNGYGGLFYNSSNALTIDNSTFYANSSSGTAISSLFHNSGTASMAFTNSIIWGNSFVTLTSQQSSSLPTFSYSIVQGINDPTNFVSNVNPLFVNPSNLVGADGIWGTADDGLELQLSSPAVDKGNNSAIPSGITNDITGSPRIQNAVVDMGAYEYIPHPGPIVITTTTNTSYTVQSPPVTVDNGVTVTDAGSPTFASATIAITGNFSSGDILAFTNSGSMGNITASYNSATGVLTLTSSGATASIAQWQAALQSITYSNSLASPNLSNRTVSFTVNDGTYNSNTATKTIVLVGAACNPTSSTTNLTICAYSLPYTWNGNTYNTAGLYTVHLTNAGGCDSAATLNLSTNSATSSTTNQTICSASLPYTWNGNSFTSAGSYIVHLTNTSGCDSAATLNLTVSSSVSSITNQTICASALPYSWNGNSYNASGSYTVHLSSTGGCDSAATLNLTVSSSVSSTTNQTICASALPYTWNGNSYNAAGSYTVHFTSASGCDSAATLVLSVSTSNPSSTSNVRICPSALPYLWNGVSYNNFGTYTAHFASNGPCDSVATLNLVNIGTSLSDSNRFSLMLSPNPASSNLSVKVSFPCGIIVFNETPTIIIYNTIGQKLMEQLMPLDDLEINVSSLPRGIYLIKYLGNGFETAEKIFKW